MSDKQVVDVAQAIFKNNLASLEDLIRDGFNINRAYSAPIGCPYEDIEEYSMSGYYLQYNVEGSTGEYVLDDAEKYGKSIKWTPLQMAAAYGRKNVIMFLLSKGVDHKVKDDLGNTAEDIADEFDTNVRMKKFFEGLKNENEIPSKVIDLEKEVVELEKKNEKLKLKLKELEERLIKIM
eukprot:gene305-6719_t